MNNLEGLSHPLPYPHRLRRLREHGKIFFFTEMNYAQRKAMQKCVNKKVKIVFTTSGITTVFIWTGVFCREIKHLRTHSWYQYDHHIQERRAVFFLCNTWCGDIEQ